MNKVLKHIAFARDWLARAEERIKTGSIMEGELYLSLAEAEIRKAWEDSYLSRRQSVQLNFWSRKRLLPLLLAIILVFVLGFSSYLGEDRARNEGIELKLIYGNWLRGETYIDWGERETGLININLEEENNMGGVREWKK